MEGFKFDYYLLIAVGVAMFGLVCCVVSTILIIRIKIDQRALEDLAMADAQHNQIRPEMNEEDMEMLRQAQNKKKLILISKNLIRQKYSSIPKADREG